MIPLAAAVAGMSRVLVATRVTAWVRRWRNGAVVLSYHNVVPDGVPRGERTLHVARTRFREQIERVAQRFRVVSIEELLLRLRDGRSLRGLAGVTFDDAYRGVLRHALPILAEFGVPATIFVVAGALERSEPFWWDRLADSTGGIIPERERLLTELCGEEARILAANPVPPSVGWDEDYLPATGEQLANVDAAAVSLGLHTVTHPNLTRITPERCAQELTACWRVLCERFDRVLPAVAYPYGAVNGAVAAAAATQGLAGFGGATGLLSHRASPPLLPRLYVGAGMSPDALEVAAAGLRFRR